jgi:hypothetical protein
MNETKSTNDIRLIAVDVAEQQARVCDARRERIEDRQTALTDTVRSNAASITALTSTVASLAATVLPLPENVKTNTNEIARLKGRPAVWAAVGATLPVLLGVLLWWFSK